MRLLLTLSLLCGCSGMALAQPALSLASSPDPSTVGQTVILTVTTQGVPAGSTITFIDGASVIGTAMASGSGASISISNFTAGTHTLVATYGAGEVFSSNEVSQVVNRLAAAVTLSSQPNPSSIGQTVTLTASLSPVGTGTVTFYDGVSQIGSATVNASGVASLTIATFTLGTHNLTAVYPGDATYAGSTSQAVSQVVTQTASVTVSASPNPAALGASVAITATLSAPSATGTVTFFDGGTSLGSAAVAGGAASISTTALTIGTHNLTATYSGDSTFPASNSAGYSETIGKPPTQISLSASPNPSTSGQTVTLTATVTPSTATGNVTFVDGSNLLGSAALSGGTATFSASGLSIATHTLTATYGGDANNVGSTSPPFLVVVNQAPGVLLQITSNPAGTSFTVSGTGCSTGAYVTPQSLNWPTGSSCIVTFTSPYSQQAGTQYVFSAWQDGPTSNPRTIATPSQPATYTANFTTQFLLTTQANPPAGGTVTGAGYYNANTNASLTATPASGYQLVDWTGTPNGVSGQSPATVSMTGPETVTANFAAVIPSPPGSYIVSQIQSGIAGQEGSAAPINSFGQVAFSTTDGRAILWTPFSANGTAGGMTDLGNLPVNGSPFSQAFAINDRGQVVGRTGTVGGSATQAFLWSPASPNGLVGSMVAFVPLLPQGTGNTVGFGINGFGQIVGDFLWTPASPNGVTGSLNADARLNNAVALNDFGQAALVSGNSPFLQGGLFTPSSANGSTGSFSAVIGEIGAKGDLLQAINRSGAVAGTSCAGTFTGPGGGCIWHGFVWTPASVNGATGNSVLIPLPVGYISMSPQIRINSAGQVVGTLVTQSGAKTPFLYTGGTIYDLSTLNGQLAGGSAAGINDSGQIVVNASGNVVYLLTPQPQAPPVPQWSITKSHNGNFALGQAGATYTITVRNSGGVATTGAAMVTENLPSGLTLVSMAGLNWTCAANSCSRSDALAPSAAYPPITVTVNVGSSVPANLVNQATVSGGGAASMTASDPTTISGVLSQTPAPLSLNPVVSTGLAQTYTFQFTDPAGWQTLSVVNVLINGSLDGRQACYLAYSVPNGVLYLVPDNGSGLLSGLPLNGSSATGNSQCTVTGAGSSASGNGNTLTLTLNIAFTNSFAGNKVVYMAARDVQNNSGWQVMGVHGVPPLPGGSPNPTGVNPASGSTLSQTLTFTYQDTSGANDLQTVWALINTAIDGRAACYVAYYRPGNQLYLYPDNGDGTQATNIVLTGNNTIANSQCSVSAQGASVQSNGNTLTVTLPVTFKAAFSGFKGVWLAAQNLAGQASPWQALGAWSVPGN